MNYGETLKYIHSLGMFSHSASLERINSVLKICGNPQQGLPVIHIAGTNGKGSVSVMTASVMTEAGYKTGLFVSPYIVDFCERIQIGGDYIPHECLCRLAQRVRAADVVLTEFEFITAAAFLYFKESGCDLAVLETGLGGRFDATNACTDDIVDVITDIGLDHTAILGDTIEKIAAEKCGIIKTENVITSPRQNKAALDVIKSVCGSVKIPDVSFLSVISEDISGSVFEYRGNRYRLGLVGEHQIYNALTAIETVRASGYAVSQKALENGLFKAFIPARLEKVSCFPAVIIDGAHNPAAAAELYKFMKPYAGRITAVFAAMRDKDYTAVMEKLFPLCKSVVLTDMPDLPRAERAKKLAETAVKYSSSVFTASNPSAALEKAVEISDKGPIFAFGSLYLAAQIRKIFK